MRCYTLSIHAWRIAPMYYVALMTFILIFSSTMVLAVDAHQMKKNKVVLYMFLTIIGGLIFGSQAWEWKTSSKGNTVLLKQRRKFTSVCR
jgi:heme/copper-type cytochrome/quinol oxidase subunit 3